MFATSSRNRSPHSIRHDRASCGARTPAHAARAQIGSSRRPANTCVRGTIDYGVDNVVALHATAEAILEVTHEWRRYAKDASLCGDWCRGAGRLFGAAAG